MALGYSDVLLVPSVPENPRLSAIIRVHPWAVFQRLNRVTRPGKIGRGGHRTRRGGAEKAPPLATSHLQYFKIVFCIPLSAPLPALSTALM